MPATMHRISKKIVSPGKHNAVKNGSTREMEEITPQRIKHWVDSFNQMKSELKYEIPNPSLHYDKNGIPPAPVTISENGELLDPVTGKKVEWDANLNLGFWDKLGIDADGCLIGEVLAPGDPEDANTPAGKLGTTIKETSIGAAKKYVDGTGKVWDDVLVHVASCVHSVEPNQENFISSEKGEYTLMSMSTLINDSSSEPGNIGESDSKLETDTSGNSEDPKEVIGLLKKIGIDLPEDTSQDNFVERLGLALRQRIADDKEHDEQLMPKAPKPADPNKQPKGSEEKPGIVTMSEQLTQKDDNSALTLAITMSALSKNTKTDLSNRLNAIIKKGGLKKEQADKLFAELDMFTMSANDFDSEKGTFKQSNFEFGIACMEALLENVKVAKNENGEVLTMSSNFTEGYNPETNIEHNHSLNDSGETLGDDEPFIMAAEGK